MNPRAVDIKMKLFILRDYAHLLFLTSDSLLFFFLTMTKERSGGKRTGGGTGADPVDMVDKGDLIGSMLEDANKVPKNKSDTHYAFKIYHMIWQYGRLGMVSNPVLSQDLNSYTIDVFSWHCQMDRENEKMKMIILR